MAALPVDCIEALFGTLASPPAPPEATDIAAVQSFPLIVQGHVIAQQKVIAAVPGTLLKKGSDLGAVTKWYQEVLKFGGDTADAKVNQQKVITLKELCEQA